MADHRQKTGVGREIEMFATTPAIMAAGQIAQAGQDLTDYWSDATTTIPDSVRDQNLAAAEFMELIALAIYQDRLVILDAPRNGQGVILAPRGETFSQQTSGGVNPGLVGGPSPSQEDLDRMRSAYDDEPIVVPADQFDGDSDLQAPQFSPEGLSLMDENGDTTCLWVLEDGPDQHLAHDFDPVTQTCVNCGGHRG